MIEVLVGEGRRCTSGALGPMKKLKTKVYVGMDVHKDTVVGTLIGSAQRADVFAPILLPTGAVGMSMKLPLPPLRFKIPLG